MSEAKPYPTKEELHELFEYDADTGRLLWKVKRTNKNIGDIAGSPQPSGYVHVKINRKYYMLHRLIWIFHNGQVENFQSLLVDHKDGNKENNKIDNLRLASRNQNAHNRSKVWSNTKIKNVHYCSTTRRYKVSIALNCVDYQKYFKTEAEAEAHAIEKRKELHGEFANHGTLQ